MRCPTCQTRLVDTVDMNMYCMSCLKVWSRKALSYHQEGKQQNAVIKESNPSTKGGE